MSLQDIGITYSGFCLTAFPHKRLADDAPWEKKGRGVTLLVEPGRLKVGQGPPPVRRALRSPGADGALLLANTSYQDGQPGSHARPVHARLDEPHGHAYRRRKHASAPRPERAESRPVRSSSFGRRRTKTAGPLPMVLNVEPSSGLACSSASTKTRGALKAPSLKTLSHLMKPSMLP